MVEFQHSVVIGKPVAQVFTYMANFENNPKWGQGIVDTKKSSEGPIGEGTVWKETIAAGKRRLLYTMTVDQYDANRRFHFNGVGSVLNYDVLASFEAAQGGTRVTVSIKGKTKGLLGALMRGTIERTFQETVTASLDGLKKVLES